MNPWEMNWSAAPAAAALPAPTAAAAATPSAAPWEMNWSAAQPETPAKKPFGILDTWPVRLAKSIYDVAKLPGEVFQGTAQVPQSANMPGGQSTEEIGRVFGLAGLINPVPPRYVPSLTKPVTPVAPSSEALQTAVDTGFQQARSAGAEITPTALGRVSQESQSKLLEAGIDATSAPKTLSILAQLERAPPGSTVTIANLHGLRKAFGNAATDAVRQGALTEAKAARTAQQSLDDYLAALPKGDVVVGDPQAAAQVLREAIGNAAAQFRSERVQKIGDIAQGNVAAANTAGQLGREIRQGANRLLKSAEMRGFSKEEIAQLEAVRRAGRIPGVAGSAVGGGGGLGTIVSGLLTSGVGPAVGFGLKRLETAAAQRQLRKLDEMIRARSPLGQQTMGSPAPYAPPAIWDPLRRLYPQIPFFAQPPQ